ncbi:MAG TPA: PD-(D/E)XK nuclease family protein [Gemmatimonadaceae bacterium]|nr:PD-(D/E)XK nuclease family protein [Gemmatimonadaceae bacterium]
MPPSRSLPARELFLHSDPALASAWARARAAPGALYVAPSAAARRLVLDEIVRHNVVTLGFTVASPARLLPLLESRAGLVAPRTLSRALESLLIGEAATTARVPLFDDRAHTPPAGAVHAVASLIRTLRLNRVSPDAFEHAGGDPRAADAYRRFEYRRRALGLHDDTDRIDTLLAAGVPSLPLVLEEPSIPHRAAWDLLEATIAGSTRCHVAVATLGARDDTPSAWPSRLAHLGFTITDESHATTPADASTRAVGGVGMHDEVELVAREMLALLRSNTSLRPGDVLGVAPNAAYLSLLADACARLGLPIASPRRRDAADVPLVRAVLDSFRLLADPEQDTTERGLALLATPYVGLAQDRHDRLARTLLLKGLGAIRTWHRFAESSRSDRFVRLAADVGRLADRLQGQRTPKELAAALTSLGLDFGFVSSGRRFNLAAGRDDALRLDQKGWECLTDAAEELDDALRVTGTTRIGAREWLAQLERLLDGVTVKIDASAQDGVHLTIAGAGLPSAAHVFAIGWREGLFPRRTREDPLLPERVKRALNEQGAMLPLAADRTAREHERRERIRRAARETLVISWPSTGEDGEQLLPSFYMDDIGITNPTRRSVGDTTWPLPLAASRGERLTRATLVARHRAADTVQAELDAVRAALSSLSSSEKRAYDGLMHAGQVIQLPTDIVAAAGPLAGAMSASQARMLVHCLYEHFGKKRLGLGVLGAPQLDPLQIGKISHGVLAEVGRVGFDPASLDGIFERWWTAKVPRELRDDAHVAFERMILHTSLTELVARERSHLDLSGTRAAHFELSFGMNDEGRDPASLPDGLSISLPANTPISHSTLRGSIDRVDVVERGGKRYGVAIDYKSGKGERYGTELEEMADFQLPIYCEVLPLFGIEAVGAVYLGVGSGERYGVVRSDFAADFLPADGGRGVREMEPDAFRHFMQEREDALRDQIARVARGQLRTKPRNDDCGYCDLRPVCRIGTFGVGGIPDEG